MRSEASSPLCNTSKMLEIRLCAKSCGKKILLRTYQSIIDDLQPSLSLIQGTGKAKVIPELWLQTVYGNVAKTLDRKILICAHSNTAVDHIVGLLGEILMSHYPRPFSLEAHFNKAKEQKLQRVSKENAEILKNGILWSIQSIRKWEYARCGIRWQQKGRIKEDGSKRRNCTSVTIWILMMRLNSWSRKRILHQRIFCNSCTKKKKNCIW